MNKKYRNRCKRRVLSLIVAMSVVLALLPAKTNAANSPIELDLSAPYAYTKPVTTCSYDEKLKVLTATNCEQFQIKLPKDMSKGETVTVRLKGTGGTSGFRSWLSDDNTSNSDSNVIKSSALAGYNNTAIDVSYDLTATTAANSILIKGPSYGTLIDSLILTSISVVYSNEITEYVIPDPYTPTKEQSPTTTTLSLTKGLTYAGASGTVSVDSLLASQRFIADPTGIESNGRLYIYGTTDEIEFDAKGNAIDNAYNTHTISCLSTSDMVNWKDEGKIDVTKLTSYAKKSWAPTVAAKVIDGKKKFFLYYTTGGDGIAMLSADSPTGPWKDPLGKRIIDRSTPTCTEAEVPWLFDPSVLVDDDGTGYIYFGGGRTDAMSDKTKIPSGRIAKLSADMTSLAETPKTNAPYYFFEDSEINKIGSTYYYSYSTRFDTPASLNSGVAQIAYYTADNPYMQNAIFHGSVIGNPGGMLYGNTYNNHHHMFQFKNKWYIAYHSTYLETALYDTKKGYRSLHIDELSIAQDKSVSATPTYAGATQVANYDGSLKTDATTMHTNGGLTTAFSESQQKMVVSKINTGDWLEVRKVDFGTTGFKKIGLTLSSQSAVGSIEVYLDSATGSKVGTIPLVNTGVADSYKTIFTDLSTPVSGVHSLYFVFRGLGYTVADWQFVNTIPVNPPVVTPTPIPTVTATPTVKPTSVPTVKPTIKPTAVPTVKPTATPELKEGSIVKVGTSSYKVTNAKQKEVSFYQANSANMTSFTIPATLSVKSVTYKVVAVDGSAFVKSSKLKQVVIGTNIKAIKTKAFYGLKNLKAISIKSLGLTTIESKAFSGINQTAVFTVPKDMKAKYKKLLTAKVGFTKKMKIKV